MGNKRVADCMMKQTRQILIFLEIVLQGFSSLAGGEGGEVAWKGNWEQQMTGAPETHYFTWNIKSKTAWTGTGNDDFGNYAIVEKKGQGKNGSKKQFRHLQTGFRFQLQVDDLYG